MRAAELVYKMAVTFREGEGGGGEGGGGKGNILNIKLCFTFSLQSEFQLNTELA